MKNLLVSLLIPPLVVMSARGEEVNSILPPRDVVVSLYDADHVFIEWEAVEGATSYLIHRQILVTDRSEGSETAKLEEPELVLVPWGSVDAIPTTEQVRVITSTLDGARSTWAVQTIVERDGVQLRSPIVFAEWVDSITLVGQQTWGQVQVLSAIAIC